MVGSGEGDTFLYYEANVVTLQLSAQSNTNANTNTNAIPKIVVIRHNYNYRCHKYQNNKIYEDTATYEYEYKYKCNTKWWWLLVSGGGDTFWDTSMLQRRQWPHKCPYSDAHKAILSLNTMQSTHVDSLHFKWRKMLFHTEKEKRVFRPGRCVLRRERARNSSTNLRFCLSVCVCPRPESILSACWITLHSDTLTFVHSSYCEDRKEASNEDLA